MRKFFIIPVNGIARLIAVMALVLTTVLPSLAQVSVTATAGTLGPTAYTRLGLAFAAINAGTHQGAITITITANTNETAVAQLNQSALPASYTSVLIKPAAATTPTISGNLANNGIIYLRGATNVTIDGSNTVGGTTRDLSIVNNTATAGSATIRIGSASAALGASNNTIKNCRVSMSGPTIGIAITSGSGVTLFGAGEAPNSNNTVQNNLVTNTQTGIYAYGNATTLDANWNVTKNDVNTVGFGGIQINNGTGTQITENVVNNVSINGTTSTAGIMLSFQAVNTTIARNKVSNVSNLAATGAYGIYMDILNTASGVNVYNNFVLNCTCPAAATADLNAHGIYIDNGNGCNIYHNTVDLATNSGAAAINGAAAFVPFPGGTISAGCVNLRDNILRNSQTTGNRYSVYTNQPSTMFTAIDYNDYISASGNLGFIGGVNRTTIAQMQAGFGGNVNSISAAATFVSATDLHLQVVSANIPIIAGTPITTPAITTDIDAGTRSIFVPTIGAHELLNRITYTTLANTCSNGNINLTGVTIESIFGVNIAGPLVPRIYFRKGAGPWNSAPGTLASGTATNGLWDFTITAATMGGVTGGDVISYYVIAQTNTAPNVYVFSSPFTGLVATSVTAVTTPPTTPNTYTVNAVSLTGLTTGQSLCLTSAATSANFPYTGTAGSPNQYTLTWSPAGPTDVSAFTAIPSPFNVAIPAGTASGVYTGTLTIRNNVTSCSQTYTLTLTLNPTPTAIGGPANVCVGSSNIYGSTPSGGAWTSSNTAVGTINSSTGIFAGLGVGTTTIAYTLSTGCNVSTTVTVAAPPGTITGSGSVCPGSTLTLGNTSPGGTWSSNFPGIASIDPVTGILTGNSTGSTTISYNVTGCIPTTTVVTVLPIPNPISGHLYVCVNDTVMLSSTSAGGTWISGNTAVGTVGSTTGIVYGVSPGLVPISYKFTSSGCFVTNTVNVSPTPGAISGSPLICEGDTVVLGNSLAGGIWTSTLPGVISVTPFQPDSAYAIANSPTGTVTITYRMATSCFVTKVMTVSTAPTAISGGGHIICSGTDLPLGNGTAGGTWSSGNLAVATVSPTGIVHGVAGGTVSISYVTTACHPVTYVITVNQTPPPITGGITLCDGAPTTTITNSTTGGVWAISGGAVITSSGVVGGMATANISGLTVGGTFVATYTVPNGCYVNAPIIVDTLPAPIMGADSVCMGVNATVTTASVGGLWSSSNSSIASVIATTGVVTGVNYGTVTITYAALSGCYRTKLFKVRTPLPAGVTITRVPDIDTLCLGVPVTFTAHHVNGGVSPGYIWQIFGVDVFSGDSVFTYTPTHGDVVSVFMSYSPDVCSYPLPAYSNMPLNIYPNVIPTVTISTSSSTSAVYLGQVITFFAEVTSGGTMHTYQWYVDNEAVPGATNSSYAHAVYNNDTVFCVVNGNPPCEMGSLGTSNSIVIQGDYLGVNGLNGIGGNLALFPNPNNGTFTLRGTLSSEGATYDVINVLGQVVHKGDVISKQGAVDQVIKLDRGLSAGTYMLRINSGTDNKIFHFIIAD